MKEVPVRRTRWSDYRALTPSLSHRSLTVGLRYSPWYVHSHPSMVRYMIDQKNGPSCDMGGTAKDSNESSSGWPSLAASWQSIFGFLYWGAHPDKPGHNRSSSPFTTIADIVERKLVSTGAEQPNYWPKTWFGADAYNVIFGVLNYTIKSVWTSLAMLWGTIKSPRQTERTKVYGCNKYSRENMKIRIKWSSKPVPHKLGRKLFSL